VRLRRGHPAADSPRLWLGLRGPLRASGVAQMLGDRGLSLGRTHVHPHMFRHSFVHNWKQSEGRDDDLIELAGWTSGKQLERYGRRRRQERAVQAHRRLSPGDRV